MFKKGTRLFFIVLCFGLIVRLFLAWIFLHHYDLSAWEITGFKTVTGSHNVYTADWGIYGYPYLPGMAIISGLMYSLYALFSSCATSLSLLHIGSGAYTILTGLCNERLYSFLLRLPMIAADLGIAFLILKILKTLKVKENKAQLASLAFFLNPFVILVGSIWGQFDAIPVFFILLAIYAFIKNQALKGSIWTGVSILFKHYTVFLLPFIYLTQKITSALKYLLLTAGIIIAVCLPYILSSAERFFYWSITSLFKRPEDLGLMMLSPHNKILKAVFFAAFLILYLYLIWQFLKKSDKSAGAIIRYSILVTLLVYVFVMFHSQFVILILPLLAIYLATNNDLISKIFYWFVSLSSTAIVLLGCWRIFTQDLIIVPDFHYLGIAWDKVYNLAIPAASFVLFLIILLRKEKGEKVLQG